MTTRALYYSMPLKGDDVTEEWYVEPAGPYTVFGGKRLHVVNRETLESFTVSRLHRDSVFYRGGVLYVSQMAKGTKDIGRAITVCGVVKCVYTLPPQSFIVGLDDDKIAIGDTVHPRNNTYYKAVMGDGEIVPGKLLASCDRVLYLDNSCISAPRPHRYRVVSDGDGHKVVFNGFRARNPFPAGPPGRTYYFLENSSIGMMQVTTPEFDAYMRRIDSLPSHVRKIVRRMIGAWSHVYNRHDMYTAQCAINGGKMVGWMNDGGAIASVTVDVQLLNRKRCSTFSDIVMSKSRS